MQELLTDIVGKRWAARLCELYTTPRDLAQAEAAELLSFGLPESKVKALVAGLELGFQSTQLQHNSSSITSSIELYSALRPHLRGEYERVVVLYVDNMKQVIATKLHSIGSSTMTVMDPKKLLREGLKLGAAAFFMGHNHPSGSVTPSRQDLEVTQRIITASNAVTMPLIDHMVVADGRVKYCSFREDYPQLWS
jgi:DNA repair protein RadC